MSTKFFPIVLLFFLLPASMCGQERLIPLLGHANQEEMGNYSKVSSDAVTIPFFDDFSGYTGCPNPQLWDGCDALVNTDYSRSPVSLGLLTLDALDAQGLLHTGAGSGRFSGDTLCSRIIRLDSCFGSRPRALTAADSVFFSCYWLPGGGVGDRWARIACTPGVDDSLILEFWNPAVEQWHQVWATGGICEDSLVARTGHAWQYLTIPILDDDYLDSTFRFRFRNVCSLGEQSDAGMAGNTDQWHIDYVRIDCNRSALDFCSRDIAFVRAAPSLLQGYRAMPARQFSAAAMVDSVSLLVNNLYGEQLSVHYQYRIFDDAGSLLLDQDEGYDNIDAWHRNYRSAIWSPQISYVYPVDPSRNQFFDVEYILKEGVSGDACRDNDTVHLRQHFANYYAYDDGTAENGYGLTSTSSKVYLACRFDLGVADTLTALDLYFNQSLDSANVEVPFRISVWDDDNGQPGNRIYYDAQSQHPVFDGINHYHRYLLSEPVVIQGRVYIGFEQSSNKFISLGFDRNNDHHEDIFYLTSNSWQSSVLCGSLMLRPCFGASARVGIDAPSFQYTGSVTTCVSLYPNPTSNAFSVDLPEGTVDDSWLLVLYDLKGRIVLSTQLTSSIDVSSIPAGFYLCRLISTSSPHQFLSNSLTIIH